MTHQHREYPLEYGNLTMTARVTEGAAGGFDVEVSADTGELLARPEDLIGFVGEAVKGNWLLSMAVPVALRSLIPSEIPTEPIEKSFQSAGITIGPETTTVYLRQLTKDDIIRRLLPHKTDE